MATDIDFNDYTIVDEQQGGDNIQVISSSQATYTNEYGANSYLYKDYTAGFWTNVNLWLTCYDNNSVTQGNTNLVICGLTNAVTACGNTWDLGGSAKGLLIVGNRPAVGSRLQIRNCETQDIEEEVVANNTYYYPKITKSAATFSCIIYDDAARTSIDDTIGVPCDDTAFRYHYALSGWDDDAALNYGEWLSDYSYELVVPETPAADTNECAEITLTSTTTAISLYMPNSLQLTNSRGLKQIHFWTGGDVVYDVGKDTESLSISGIETNGTWSANSTEFYYLDYMADNGEEITIAGIGNDLIDTTWIISDYSYTVNGGTGVMVNYNITLEKT